jgi:GTP-dependent phosphoenolpyruvate carboxykinase
MSEFSYDLRLNKGFKTTRIYTAEMMKYMEENDTDSETEFVNNPVSHPQDSEIKLIAQSEEELTNIKAMFVHDTLKHNLNKTLFIKSSLYKEALDRE